MKKAALGVLSLCLLLVFCACSSSKKSSIEDYQWKMQLIQSNDINAEQNTDLSVIAVGTADDLHPHAPVVELILTAADGKLSLEDKTNHKEYEGSYLKQESTPDGIIYEVVVNGQEGYATVSTTKSSGTETPTMPINLGDYSIYFVPAE